MTATLKTPLMTGQSTASSLELLWLWAAKVEFLTKQPHNILNSIIIFQLSFLGDMLPDHLGDVIGDMDSATYYRIEIHYENPQGKECNSERK